VLIPKEAHRAYAARRFQSKRSRRFRITPYKVT